MDTGNFGRDKAAHAEGRKRTESNGSSSRDILSLRLDDLDLTAGHIARLR
jgi:hypothetical protein